jgi:hypothetical protein
MRLLKSRIVMFTLRRSTCSMWLPPIDRPSPSPVTRKILRSGRATRRPVAMAGARPWIVWKPYVFM